MIDVQYEVLPPVLTIKEALALNAPVIHDSMTARFRIDRFEAGEDIGKKGNIASHLQHKRGDLEAGFADADLIVEREFTTQMVHQGYLEPQSSTVNWNPDGHITIWTSTQSTFGVRAATASVLAVPESQITVVPMEIGGGFGGKLGTYLDPVAALLSRKSAKPVKMSLSRQEVLEATGPTSGSDMRCKIGVRNDGTITAVELYLAFEAGAFPGSAVGGAAMCGLGPYKIDNLLVDGYDVIVNRPKTGAYRAPGQPLGAFAVEGVIDEIADKLGMDSMDLRLKNVVEEGDRMPHGVQYRRIGLRELEEAMKTHPHYSAPLEGANRGRGIAVGFRFNAGGHSTTTVSVEADGTVKVITGVVDIGGSRAAFAMHAAEVLGLNTEDIHPTTVDTDSIGFSGATAGSRACFDTGLAVMAAAEMVKQEMRRRAARVWETDAESITFSEGVFTGPKEGQRFTFKELAGQLNLTGGPVSCTAINENLGVGPTFGGNIADVEVDPETGKVQILRYTAFMDAGRAIHPSYVEGQLQGGTVQGIGWALNEEYFYDDDGVMRNSSLLDYRTPTTLDVPMIDAVLIEVPHPLHPLGTRGVGEIPIVPPLATVALAVSNAIGIRIRDLPLSPRRILEAIEAESAPSGNARDAGTPARTP